MALLQRQKTLRLGKCCPEASSLRAVLVGSSKAPMRRFGAHGLADQAANRLAQHPRQLMGCGHCMLHAVQGRRQRTIMRSFLGVGAPEAILVAVVALVVFGPKGLADAAKSLGQTLRAFQPTIREVVEVSNEIKGTLEQELGLDEIREAASMRPTPKPLRSSSVTSSTSDEAASSSGPILQPITEDVVKQIDPDIELKRAMSEQAAWGGQTPVAKSTSTAAAGSAAAAEATAAAGAWQDAAAPAVDSSKDLSALSLEELEAELARRRKSA